MHLPWSFPGLLQALGPRWGRGSGSLVKTASEVPSASLRELGTHGPFGKGAREGRVSEPMQSVQ